MDVEKLTKFLLLKISTLYSYGEVCANCCKRGPIADGSFLKTCLSYSNWGPPNIFPNGLLEPCCCWPPKSYGIPFRTYSIATYELPNAALSACTHLSLGNPIDIN